MSKNLKDKWNNDDRDRKRSEKSVNRKKNKGQRHHVRDIMNDLKNQNDPEAYLDYADEMMEDY
jgi:hypothetical protein